MDIPRKQEIPMNTILDDEPNQHVSPASIREPGGSYTNPFGEHSDTASTVRESPGDPFSSNKNHPAHRDPNDCCRNCWYDRTGIEKCLMVIFLLCIILASIFVATITAPRDKGNILAPDTLQVVNSSSIICISPDCVKTAGEMIMSMDKSVSPCDNFYQFACGGWHKKNPLPTDKHHWDAFGAAFEEVNYRLKDILEAPPPKEEPLPIQNLRKGYNACVNQTAWDVAGIQPMMKIYREFGGFPMIMENWELKQFDLFKTIANLRRIYDEQYLVGVYVIPDMKNSSKYSIYLDEGYLPADRDLLAKNDPLEREEQIQRMRTVTTMLYEGSMSPDLNPGKFPLNHFHQPDLTNRKYDKQQENITATPKKNIKTVFTSNSTVMPTNGSSPKTQVPVKKSSTLKNASRLTKTPASAQSIPSDIKAELKGIKQEIVIRNDAWELWYYYVKLAKFMDETPDIRDDEKTYNPMKVSELKKFNHRIEIDWLAFLKDVFLDTGVHVDENTTVIVTQPEYFHKLTAFILATPPRVLANAMMYQLTLNLGTEIKAPRKYQPQEEKMEGVIGRFESRPWFDCVQKMDNLMGMAMGRLFLTHQEQEVKRKTKSVEDQIRHLKRTLTQTLEDVPWLDRDTKLEAIRKSNQINPVVGMPKKYQNNTELEKFYSNLEDLSPTDHFGNIRKLLSFTSSKSLQKAGRPPSRDKALTSPLTVNSYYSSQRNSIQFPLGMMTSPFFRENTTSAIRYGSTGTIISHELFHGFDVRGRKWDSKGSLRSWWSEASLMKYLQRAHCFENEYSHLPVAQNIYNSKGKKLKIDAKRTMAENIADAQGLMLSWNSYRKDKIGDKRLIGLDEYSPDQLFYIAYGQMWCTNYSPEGLVRSMEYDSHSPSPFRVNGAVRNHPPFAKAFQCSKKSKMVDDKICKIW